MDYIKNDSSLTSESVKEHSVAKLPVITFGELSLVHCLGTAGIPVFTASEKTPNVTYHSRFSKRHLVFSSYESSKFIDELCTLGASFESKVMLMGHDDRALLSISKHRKRLEDYFLFLLPDHEMVTRILDKLLFCRLCEEYELPAPASIEISGLDQVKQVHSKLKAPYIIKPAYRHYWYNEEFVEVVGHYQKAFVCDNYDDLEALYRKIMKVNPSVVVQEYVVGDDNRLFDVNLNVDAQGNIDAYAIGQKLRVYPPKAGWGSYVKTVEDEEMLDICAGIIDKLNLKGMVNIQFKKDSRTDEPKLIEIHTRSSIFDFLGASAGQNVPARYYSDITGVKIKSETYRSNVTYLNIARDLRLFIRYRKEYGISWFDWLKTYSGVAVYDGMLFKDPKAMYYELQTAFSK